MAHRFIVGQDPGRARHARRPVGRGRESVDLLGEATVTQTEGRRYAARCAEALDAMAAASARWPARPALERDPWGRSRARTCPSRCPPSRRSCARRAGARQARRRRAPARAAAARACARCPPPHRHGVAGLARRGARVRPRAAHGGGVPRRTVGRARPAGLPARLAADARHDPRVARAAPGAPSRSRSGSSRAPTGTTRSSRRASTAGRPRCSRSRPTATATSRRSPAG